MTVSSRRPFRRSSFLVIVVFVCPGAAHARISRGISPIFARIKKIIISPLNSANFSTLERMQKTKFQDPFFGFGVPHLGLLISGGLESPLGSIGLRFPSVLLVCRNTFFVAQDIGNSAVFASSYAHVSNCWNVSQQQKHL